MQSEQNSLKLPLLFQKQSFSQNQCLQINLHSESKLSTYHQLFMKQQPYPSKSNRKHFISEQIIDPRQVQRNQNQLRDENLSNQHLNDQIGHHNHKKSIHIRFKKNQRDQKKKNKKRRNIDEGKDIKVLRSKIHNNSISSLFEVSGLKMKTNWQVNKKKCLNSKIFHISEKILKPLYYFNLFFNSLYRLSMILIMTMMFIDSDEFLFMQIIIILEMVVIFLYILAMMKFLYTRKDEESIYFQKYFSDRDITDIEMDRVLRKHFTFENILTNVTTYIKPNTKFRKNVKIAFLKQEIFKRMEIVLTFIPLTVGFLTVPKMFSFQCEIPIDIILSATISVELIRMAIHYLVIFIYS